MGVSVGTLVCLLVGTIVGLLWNPLRKPGWSPRTSHSEKKRAYTTTTERKSFGELFWSQRKTFQACGGYKNPIKTRKTISTTEICPLWTTFFSAKRSSALEQGGVWLLFPNSVYGFFLPIHSCKPDQRRPGPRTLLDGVQNRVREPFPA